MNFVNLFVETNFSMNGSNIKIKELIKKALTSKYTSLAITDKKMYGVIKFYKECVKNNIKPIIGLNIMIEGMSSDSRNNILVYAKNNEGYQNLLKLASIQSLKAIITLSELEKYNNNIIGVVNMDNSELLSFFTSNQINELNESIKLLTNVIQDIYFRVSNNDELNEFISKNNKIVVLDYAHYLEEEDYLVSNTLKKIFSKESGNLFSDNLGNHFKTTEEINKIYKSYPKAIENTNEISKKCNVSISFDHTYLPTFNVKQKVSAKDYLHALAYKGLEKRLVGIKVNKKIYLKRLKYELKIIDNMGYNDYFLIVWDFVKYAKKKKYLVGPGRGSAAASLVSYCLGITSVDSIKYDLVFERFLNPERITLPDIDMDLPDDKRDDIIKYVRDLYGINKVASICTFGTFLSKSAIRDTARVLEIDGLLLDEIIKHTKQYINIKDMLENSKEIQNIISRDKKAENLLMIASKIEGLHRHVSTHAAGIIITSKDLTEHTAVQNGLLDMMQTQFEAKDLEELGLLKIDFLGLSNLTTINKVVNLINSTENKNLNIYKVPLTDKLTFDLLKRVETTGIFQLESQGMRSLIGKMQIDNFEDIVTILALYRPGPMENIPSYLRRRQKREKIVYPHKVLEDILSSTNGIIIYQEQILKIANLFAGYSLGEADILRRAVSKKQHDVLEKERTNFVRKATKLGRSEISSNEIYDYIVKFANYGFNRAHSVAYAMVSYWMAYLKANYPKQFISVLLSSIIGSENHMRNYIFEANKLGVVILPPSINNSNTIFKLERENLRYPLLGIKNIGINTVKSILEERENGQFKSYIDFVSRTHSFLNVRVIESLISASALDEFNLSKRTMFEKLDEVISFTQYGNFISKEDFVFDNLKEYTYAVLEENEKNVLGFNLVMNPMLEFKDYIKTHNLYKPSTISKKLLGKEIKLVGILSSIKKIKTKKGTDMAFVSIHDEYSKLDGVLFTNVYIQYIDIIENNSIYLLMASIEERNGNLQLVIKKIHKL